jgi:hypothetical protein
MTEPERHKIMRNLLEMHREHLLERADEYEQMAKACRAAADKEQALFAKLWGERDMHPMRAASFSHA